MTVRILPGLIAVAWFSLPAAQTAQPPAASSIAAPAASTAVAPSPPSTGGDEPTQPTMFEDKESISAAQKWLELLDTGKLGTAWDVSAKYLKSTVTRAEWVKGVADARKPYGKFKSRTAARFARSHSLPGAPDGDYAIIEFESAFANGKKAAEQVIWMFEPGDKWRVSGYFIR